MRVTHAPAISPHPERADPSDAASCTRRLCAARIALLSGALLASCSSDGSLGANSLDGGGSTGSTPLLLGMTLHLENKTFDAAYFASLDAFAKTFESHTGKLTFEPRDQVVSAALGPPQRFDWKTLEARGHAVGSHAGIGGTMSTPLSTFTSQAKMRLNQLAPLVSRLDHISGNCGNVDWITGIADAGFTFTTAATVLCMYSMQPADRPAPYMSLSCAGATDPICHTSYPSDLSQRIHPWRAQDSGHWLTDSKTGRIVIVPGSGTLPCLEEEAKSTGGSLPTCTLTEEDVTRALADLDAAIPLVDAGRINSMYWVWGSWSISAAEQPILESFLTQVDQRIAKGQVKWSTLPGIYDAFLDWEKTHR
jgi:hypothetical protein